MITEDKIIQIFCIIDELNKNFNVELDKKRFYATGIRYRNRKGQMSESEIITIMTYLHFDTYCILFCCNCENNAKTET